MQRNQNQPQPFQLELIEPFTTLCEDGTVSPTPYIVDGLLTQGGLSVLGAKPKVGKSSLSRHLAVSVAKGAPFLGRATTRGEVLLCSLEDPRTHLDNCLSALGYDPQIDSKIHIVERVSPNKDETIARIREVLVERPDIRLIIVDHLAKLLNLADFSEYMPTLRGIGVLHDLARDFPHLHVTALAHSKKVKCDDPFDGILGSTALRGEPDTNIVLMNERGHRVIVTETRVGRAIPATILQAEMVTSAGSDVARDYILAEPFDQWDRDHKDRADKKQGADYTNRIMSFLAECEGQTALQSEVLKSVKGQTARIINAIKELEAECIVSASGTPKMLQLNLSGEALRLYQMKQLS